MFFLLKCCPLLIWSLIKIFLQILLEWFNMIYINIITLKQDSCELLKPAIIYPNTSQTWQHQKDTRPLRFSSQPIQRLLNGISKSWDRPITIIFQVFTCLNGYTTAHKVCVHSGFSWSPLSLGLFNKTVFFLLDEDCKDKKGKWGDTLY